MKINADLGQRAVMYSEELPWVASPLPGVDRRMLERDGAEVARATSVVRYAPDSAFDAHAHGGGEEFFVLEGVFSDEHGDFGPGMYVRNPPGSRHTPRSAPGCSSWSSCARWTRTIRSTCASTPPRRSGSRVRSRVPASCRCSSAAARRSRSGDWRRARASRHEHPGGEETFVLDGVLEDELGRYPRGAWLRNPPGSAHQPFSPDGCLLYLKTGHLGEARYRAEQVQPSPADHERDEPMALDELPWRRRF